MMGEKMTQLEKYKFNNEPIRILEFFSGVGMQRMAFDKLGVNYESVGTSEIDIPAILSYAAIHDGLLESDETFEYPVKEEMLNYLTERNIGLDFKTGKLKLPKNLDKIKQLYRATILSKCFGDISKINPSGLPDFDFMTYSFPCTDISVAGRKDGVIKGQTRSGLLYECEKVIECKRPKYLLLENVKNLVGKQFKPQFDEWLEYLETLGYTNYWKVLNSKSFGVPQNRERVFVLSILGEHNPYEFHNGFELNIRLKDVLESNVDEKYYLSKEVQDRFKPNDKFKDMSGNIVGTTAPDFRTIGQRDLCYQENSVMGTLVATDYKQPKQIVERIGGLFDDEKHIRQAGGVYNVDGLSPTLTAMYNGYKQPCVIDNSNKPYFVDRQGRVQEFDLKENYIQWDTSKKQYNSQQDRAFYDEKLSGTIATNAMANVIENSEPLICASRGRNPENPSDRTAGIKLEQRLEINYSGTSNTITTVQKDNYVLEPNVLRAEYDDTISEQCENNVNIVIGSTQKNAYVGNGEMSPTLTSAMGTGGGHIPMIGNIPNFRIRKLTPRECWRLMGIDDECFDKAQQVNSNSQLYKQAGNGIVVDVLYYIFKELFKDNIVDCKES